MGSNGGYEPAVRAGQAPTLANVGGSQSSICSGCATASVTMSAMLMVPLRARTTALRFLQSTAAIWTFLQCPRLQEKLLLRDHLSSSATCCFQDAFKHQRCNLPLLLSRAALQVAASIRTVAPGGLAGSENLKLRSSLIAQICCEARAWSIFDSAAEQGASYSAASVSERELRVSERGARVSDDGLYLSRAIM